MLSAAAATALGTITVLASAGSSNHLSLILIAIGWWLLAVLIGLRLGRRAQTTPPIARLLSGGLAFLAPQIPCIATGFAIIWALAWRRQDAAVTAIEERDGACFYVRRTSPLRPMELVRTPGFKTSRAERVNGAVT